MSFKQANPLPSEVSPVDWSFVTCYMNKRRLVSSFCMAICTSFVSLEDKILILYMLCVLLVPDWRCYKTMVVNLMLLFYEETTMNQGPVLN